MSRLTSPTKKVLNTVYINGAQLDYNINDLIYSVRILIFVLNIFFK